jgi:hypothetical protein
MSRARLTSAEAERIAERCGITVSRVRQAFATAKREGRKVTDWDLMPPEPTGPTNAEFIEMVELSEAVWFLNAVPAIIHIARQVGGWDALEHGIAAYRRACKMREERKPQEEADSRGVVRRGNKGKRGRRPHVTLKTAGGAVGAAFAVQAFEAGWRGDESRKGTDGGRPKMTVDEAAEILRTQTARRVKDSPVTKSGGWAASKDNSARGRARDTIRDFFAPESQKLAPNPAILRLAPLRRL